MSMQSNPNRKGDLLVDENPRFDDGTSAYVDGPEIFSREWFTELRQALDILVEVVEPNLPW